MLWLGVIAGALFCATLGYMAIMFWIDPDRGLAETTHRAERLPRVMADRYTAFAILAGVFTWHALITGEFHALSWLFAVNALIGFCDGAIYARAGEPHVKHTASGGACLIGLALCRIAA